MCEKCADFTEKIEHYKRLAAQVMDDLTSERIGKLIAELAAEKLGLHPSENEDGV